MKLLKFSANTIASLRLLRSSLAAALVYMATTTSAGAEVVVALSGDGVMRLLDDPDCTGAACNWVDIDRNSRSIALTATDSSIFQLHNSGNIWQWRGQPCEGSSCPHWTRLDNNGNTIAIAANFRDLFQLHRGGSVWRWRGEACRGSSCPSWERISNDPTTVAIAAAGHQLFKLQSNGEIWYWQSSACGAEACRNWVMLDRNPNTRQIFTTGYQLYQRHENGTVWQWQGRACDGTSCTSWRRLDNNPATQTLAAATDNLFQLHSSGAIWRWLGRACDSSSCPHWERLDNNPSTRAVAAATTIEGTGRHPLYQVHANGRVWRWLGTACSGSSCPGWVRIDNGNAFTRFDVSRGGLYVFDGNSLKFASTPIAGDATANTFGYDTLRLNRVSDRRERVNVMLLLTSYANSSFDASQTEAFYRDKFFTGSMSLQNYFNNNSSDLSFEINLAGVAPVRDPRPLACAHRWSGALVGDFREPTCPTGRPDDQSFTMSTVEQLESLSPAVAARFAAYDTNRDNVITPNELLVLNLQALPERGRDNPYGDNGGLLRGLPRCATLAGTGKRICGAFIPTGDDVNTATVAHELAHVFGTSDLYGETGNNSFSYSVMGATISDREMFFHFDPWHKMRLGMVKPRVLNMTTGQVGIQSLRLTIPHNRASYEPVVFYDPERGISEFFMLEYRRARASSFDYDVRSSGLVIWYIKTDPGTYRLANLRSVSRSLPEGAANAIIGAPLQSVATGRAWTASDGEIMLQWPDGTDSGLRITVDPAGAGDAFLTLDWYHL